MAEADEDDVKDIEIGDLDKLEVDMVLAMKQAESAHRHAEGFIIDRLEASCESDSDADSGFVSSTIRARKGAWLAEELADLMGFSKQHIYKLAKAGRIPCHRVGGAIRFDPYTVADWWDDKVAG